MKTPALAVSLALAATTALASPVTFHKEDQDILKQFAPFGITLQNWDANEYSSMNLIEAQRFSDYALIERSENPRTFEASEKSLDMTAVNVPDLDGIEIPLYDFMRDRMHNRSMVVLQDGKLVHEHYWSGTNPDTKHFTMSAGKSITSTLMGIAEGQGFLSFDDPAEKFYPELMGTVLEGVPLQYISDMRSGFGLIDETENGYGDDWDQSMGHAMAYYGSEPYKWSAITEYAPHLKNSSYEPGKKFEYRSFNPEVLSMVTQRAVGDHWTQYFYDQLWNKGQFTSDVTIMVDRKQDVIGSGALTMTTRDFANMGDIWVHDGKSQNGTQVVPAEWLNAVWEGNDEVRETWLKGKEAGLAEGFYKDQFRVLSLGGKDWLIAVGVNGQIVAAERESKTVIAMFSNYNEPTTTRMALGFFQIAIPAIEAAIS